jgi:hypothetical protein
MKKIPKFKSDKEVARFWETHSFEDYHRDTKEAEMILNQSKSSRSVRV